MLAETYVNQIVKKIKCPKQKKDEIRRQLLADVNGAIQQGTPLEKVILQMGEPIAIAEAFNEDLPENDRKAYRRGVIIKIVLVVAAVLFLLGGLAVWFLPKGAEVGSSGIYHAEQVERRSKEVIQLLDAQDYDKLLAYATPQMKRVLTKEVIADARKQVAPDIADWGKRRKFGKCYMQEIRQQGKTSVVVQFNVTYENTGVTYTLMFDDGMRLAGLYMK